MDNSSLNSCPICGRTFSDKEINDHVDKCLFLHSNETEVNISNAHKRDITLSPKDLHSQKKPKLESPSQSIPSRSKNNDNFLKIKKENATQEQKFPHGDSIPLAENMRPNSLEEYVGQNHILGKDKILRQLLLKKDIPSMILWGPPGCGKTSLANVISNICKEENNMRFVKLSATMSGINDVKEVVKVAKNEAKFKRRTVLFMDEIHRFNKLQQDTFLPHIENGTLVLIGATTENPSFSLNSALLSRCRVIVLEKLTTKDVLSIVLRAVETKYKVRVLGDDKTTSEKSSQYVPRLIIELQTLKWLAEICDGDARVALSSLQLSVQAKDPGDEFETSGPTVVSLEDIKDGIKRSHLLYDRKGDEHYNMISALHKSIRASDDNAALYWLTRMLQGGEDPMYIARRMVRIAGEDIGIADPKALNLTVSCMQGCQLIGMPECDVLLAQCAVYLARADKSTEVYHALQKCKQTISEHKGPLPSVPLHLRNAPTKLMAELGHGQGYNTRHRDESNLTYMPEGMEDTEFLD